jgi:hypothetical protein
MWTVQAIGSNEVTLKIKTRREHETGVNDALKLALEGD